MFCGHRNERPSTSGILVVYGGAGLDDHARQRAQRMAELSFVAFACDMYGDGKSTGAWQQWATALVE